MISKSLAETVGFLLSKVQTQEPDVKRRAEEITRQGKRWMEAGQSISESWSGSFCGYHSELYFRDFERPPLGSRFSPEWGGVRGLPTGWNTRLPNEVKAKMQSLADTELEPLETKTAELLKPLMELHEELVSELLPLHNVVGLEKQKELLERIENFKWGVSRGNYIKDNTPTQFGTRDSEAINQGIKLPAHIFYEAVAAECCSRCAAAEEFLKLSQRLLRTLITSSVIATNPVGNTRKGKKIFIGHGRSLLWLKLRIFLSEKLHLECDEFNEESPAGIPTVTRLQTMLDDAQFAFLVMTSEDLHADGTTHTRENVVHEAGLFQGRLGFGRAIILLEYGCTEFSNIHGLGQIRFPKDDIDTVFEKIREVLKREGVT